MTTLSLAPRRSGPIFGPRAVDLPAESILRERSVDPCGGEHVIDFALCLVIAAAIVGLLLLAL